MYIDLSKYKVSYQNNTWANISEEISVCKTLDLIKSDLLKVDINALRDKLAENDKEFYNSNKLKLPAVTFCATFNSKRKKEDLKHYNSLIVIDIDKLSSEEMSLVSNHLSKDEYIISHWRSPSNRGYKGLVHINYTEKIEEDDTDIHHKYAFNLLSDYFIDKYKIELDKSGSDITRLCFLSFDENLLVKKDFSSFQIDNSEVPFEKIKTSSKANKLKFSSNKDALYNPLNRNSPYDRKIMSNLIRFLNNKNLSITENYLNWYKVAMGISNSFTYDVGLKYFIKISKRDTHKFNEINCSNFLTSCYENRNGQINLASAIYLANNKGFKTKYQRNGVPKVEG